MIMKKHFCNYIARKKKWSEFPNFQCLSSFVVLVAYIPHINKTWISISIIVDKTFVFLKQLLTSDIKLFLISNPE